MTVIYTTHILNTVHTIARTYIWMIRYSHQMLNTIHTSARTYIWMIRYSHHIINTIHTSSQTYIWMIRYSHHIIILCCSNVCLCPLISFRIGNNSSSSFMHCTSRTSISPNRMTTSHRINCCSFAFIETKFQQKLCSTIKYQ